MGTGVLNLTQTEVKDCQGANCTNRQPSYEVSANDLMQQNDAEIDDVSVQQDEEMVEVTREYIPLPKTTVETNSEPPTIKKIILEEAVAETLEFRPPISSGLDSSEHDSYLYIETRTKMYQFDSRPSPGDRKRIQNGRLRVFCFRDGMFHRVDPDGVETPVEVQ